jgi:hypothetical protein
MLGEASEFTPLDLLGALALNAVTTNVACKRPEFRWGIKNKKQEVPAWADFRFLGGMTAGLVGQFGGPNVRRVGTDLAVGLLGSYVATETCRRHAMAKLNQAQAAQAQAALPPPAAAAPAPAAAAPAAATAGYGYAW